MMGFEGCVQMETGCDDQINVQERRVLPAWMNAASAISWVAFGHAGAWESWGEFTRRRLHRSWREWELPFGVIGLEDEAHALLAAFQARAAGEPWRPCDQADQPPYFFRAKVRRVMRRTELPAQQLASELGKDIEAQLELDKQLDRARDAIVAAVRERRLPAWGRLVAGGSPLATRPPHEKIDPALFLSPLTIGRDNEVAVDTRLPEREWLTYQGPRFVEVHFDGQDVVRLWPELHLAHRMIPDTPVSDRPKPTDAAVERFLKGRVVGWVDDLPAPTEADDWAAASAHFGDGLTRDGFRQIRKRTAPLEWLKSGPRRNWGEVKRSAREAAKLRPQD